MPLRMPRPGARRRTMHDRPPTRRERRRAGRWAVATTAWLTVLVCVGGCSTASGGGPDPETIVRTPDGEVRGIVDDGTRRHLGIRYAEPPVGPQRWAPPVPVRPWEGSRAATAPGPRCPQTATGPSEREQDEDCLFLDVTTPDDVADGERLPVVVWWHGGGFLTGSGSEYGAQRLADQGRLAVVTVNYRLGTLGYLGLPGLAGSGAFGFADQIESLRWTRRNIASFGGDPDNITVAGQSAGGGSACALLTSPALTELAIRNVIVMSGPCSGDLPAGGLTLNAPPRGLYTTTPAAQAAGRNAAAALGCAAPEELTCLRNLPVDRLLTRSGQFSALAWGGDLLPADPAVGLGAVPRSVSVLYGGTRDEGRSFFRRTAQVNPRALAPEAYDGLLADGFGAAAGRVREQYPLDRFDGSAGLAWSTVATDSGWACPTRRDQRTLAGRGPTYAFEFSRPDGPPGPGGFPSGGAGHGSELPLLFDRPGQPPAGSETELSRLVIEYWSTFARTGRPESPAGPSWPPSSPADPATLQLDPTSVTEVDTAAVHRCDFWDSLDRPG